MNSSKGTFLGTQQASQTTMKGWRSCLKSAQLRRNQVPTVILYLNEIVASLHPIIRLVEIFTGTPLVASTERWGRIRYQLCSRKKQQLGTVWRSVHVVKAFILVRARPSQEKRATPIKAKYSFQKLSNGLSAIAIILRKNGGLVMAKEREMGKDIRQ